MGVDAKKMQLNYLIPDVALIELILYLTPKQLLSLAEGESTGVQIVDDNLETVRALLKSKEVLGRLCSYYDGTSTRCDTLEDYLLGYDYWNLDCNDVDYHWFEKRWKHTLDIKRVLYIAARNAEKDIRFLTVVDEVLKENYLACSEEHVYLVCRGLVWSPELQKKYLAPLVAYMQIQNPTSVIAKEEVLINVCKKSPYWTPYEFYCRPLHKESNRNLLQTILESEGNPLNLKQTKLALRILDWQDFRKVTLGELSRLEKIRYACRNNDGRILRSLKPTLEEILESMGVVKSALVENEAMKERFLDIVLRNPKHNDNQTWYFAFLWYDDFEGDRFCKTVHEMCAIPSLNGDHILCTPFYCCFYELGLELDAVINDFLPILVRRFTNQSQRRFADWAYRPKYIRYFVPKYLEMANVNLERLKNVLLDYVHGDAAMTSWVNELQ